MSSFLPHTKSQQCGWKTCLTFENCFLLPLLDYTLTIVDRCRNLCFSLVCHCTGPSSNWHIPKVHTLAIDGVWQWYRFKLLPFTKYSSFVASCLVMKAKSANKTLIMYEQRKSHIFTSNRHRKKVLSSSSSSSECKVDRMRRSRDSRGRWWVRWVHSCFVEGKLTCCIPLGGIQFFRQTKESCLRSLSNKICLNRSGKKKINNKIIVLTRNSNEQICLSKLFCAGIWQIVHRNLSTGEQNFITKSANSSFFFFFTVSRASQQQLEARSMHGTKCHSKQLAHNHFLCSYFILFCVF